MQSPTGTQITAQLVRWHGQINVDNELDRAHGSKVGTEYDPLLRDGEKVYVDENDDEWLESELSTD